MCLTANPTDEWTLSMVQRVATGTGVEVMVVIVSSWLCVGVPCDAEVAAEVGEAASRQLRDCGAPGRTSEACHALGSGGERGWTPPARSRKSRDVGSPRCRPGCP